MTNIALVSIFVSITMLNKKPHYFNRLFQSLSVDITGGFFTGLAHEHLQGAGGVNASQHLGVHNGGVHGGSLSSPQSLEIHFW